MNRVKHNVLFAVSLGAAAMLASCTPAQTTGTTTGTTPDTTGAETAATTPAATVSPTPAPAPAGPAKKVAEVEGISEYQLDNGLRVLLFPDQSQAKVTVNITYFVGSKHEGYGETGMAHLLEHMVFKGTPTHDDIWKLLEAHGASFNGTTWLDRTNYYETLPATPENLEFALALEADRMINSTIAAEDLATEFSVVRNEFELGENFPRGVLIKRMMSAAYLWHNYGKSTIGNKSDIEKVPVENLRRFYKRYYQPDNAMLVVAGKFDEAQALDLIQKHYAPIPRPERQLTPTYTIEPVQDGERQVTLRRVGDVGVVGVMYHGVPGSHADFPASRAVAHVLTDEPSGRLYKALVKTGMATAVYGFSWSLAEPGAIQFYAEVAPGKPLAPVRDKMLSIIEGLGKSQISDEEITRFKNRFQKDLRLTMTNSQRIAIWLTEWSALGDWRMLFVNRDRMEQVKADQVKRVASEYLKRSNRTVGMFIPTKKPDRAPQPTVPDVVELTRDYKGRTEMASGEVFEATVANVESRTQRSKLKNGMKVALLPKETRGDSVKIALTIRYGSERTLKGKTTAAGLIPTMLMRGTKKKNFQQLKDELDKLGAQVRFSSRDTGTASASITTTRENVVAVLGMLAEIVKQPAFAASEFAIVKKERLAELEESKNDPFNLAFIRMNQRLNPYPKNDIRHVPTVEENIARMKRVTVGQLKSVHAQLWGASGGQITVVGDFDAEAVKAEIARHFETWNARQRFQRIAWKKARSRTGYDVIETPDKKNSLIAAGHNFEMRDDDPDYPALEMAAYILGGSASSRLLNRLRQKEGLSYGAFGSINVDSIERDSGIFTGAIVNPDNAAKAMDFLMEEIRLMVAKGVTEEELAKAKESYVLKFRNRLASDDFLVAVLNRDLHIDRAMTYYDGVHAAMARLTTADIQRVIAKYLRPDQMFQVRAGDFRKK